MKKKIYLLAGTLFVLSLCSCSIQISTDGNHQESSSATTSSSSSEGNSSEVPWRPVHCAEYGTFRVPSSALSTGF